VVATLSFLAAQAEEAAGSLSGTQTARNQAFQQASDPSLAGWDARVTAARAVIDGLQAQARTQQAEMEALATRCVAQINQAMPGGHKNRSLLGWLGHDAAAVVHGAVGVADDLFVRPFTGLGHEAGKLVDHWTWEDVGKTLGDVAGVLGVVALIPGADVLAVPALIVVSGFAAGADLAAREEHERGATFTEAGLVAGQGLLAGLGAVFEAAGAAGSLADDADAQESGWALLKSGIKQMPDWADVKASLADTYNEVRPAMNEADGITLPSSEDVRGALNNVSDSLTGIANEWLHLGADGSALSPAATSYQHLGFVVRRTADGLTVFDSQLESNSQSSSQGPPA